MHASSQIAPVLWPELLRGEPGSFDQGSEFGPGDTGSNGARPDKGIEAAICAGDNILAAQYARETDNSLGHNLRVLDIVGARIDHSRNEYFSCGQTHLLEYPPLMFVARIGSFEGERTALDCQKQVDDLFQGNIPVMWTVIIAPAHMHAYPVWRETAKSIIEHFYVLSQVIAKFVERSIGKANVTLHSQVWTIQLQEKSSRDKSFTPC
jgi:hypothetical protein